MSTQRIITLILITTLLPLLPATAQELMVKRFEETNDLAARVSPRYDFNNEACALLKIEVMDKITNVEYGGVGDVIDKGVEKWSYIIAGQKHLKFHFEKHFPVEIITTDYGINGLKGSTTYVLRLVEANNEATAEQKPAVSKQSTTTYVQSSSNDTPNRSSINEKALQTIIRRARTAEQKGDYAKAISILEDVIQNPKVAKSAEIYNVAAEDHAKLFNNELNRAAQQLPFDTVAFTTHLDKAIEYYTKSHEANLKPDAKGRVNVDEKIQFANHMRLGFMLDYYNYAAMFMYQRGDTAAAINYFEKYLELPKNPIFSQHETDSIYANPNKKAGYMQTRCNIAMLQFNRKNWDEAIKYADEALKDTLNTRDLYIIKMQSYLAKNDSASYLTALAEAIGRTEDEGFMQNLLYYYVSNNQLAPAEKMASELIATAPEKKSSWYMKGCVELNMKKDYAAARKSFAKALAIDPNFVDANINMAYTYMNEGRDLQLSGKFKILGKYKTYTKAQEPLYKKELAEVRAYYENARPYMEKVRELTPSDPKRWAYSLQMIYENLGLKNKKAEIDNIIVHM